MKVRDLREEYLTTTFRRVLPITGPSEDRPVSALVADRPDMGLRADYDATDDLRASELALADLIAYRDSL